MASYKGIMVLAWGKLQPVYQTFDIGFCTIDPPGLAAPGSHQTTVLNDPALFSKTLASLRSIELRTMPHQTICHQIDFANRAPD